MILLLCCAYCCYIIVVDGYGIAADACVVVSTSTYVFATESR